MLQCSDGGLSIVLIFTSSILIDQNWSIILEKSGSLGQPTYIHCTSIILTFIVFVKEPSHIKANWNVLFGKGKLRRTLLRACKGIIPWTDKHNLLLVVRNITVSYSGLPSIRHALAESCKRICRRMMKMESLLEFHNYNILFTWWKNETLLKFHNYLMSVESPSFLLHIL